MTDPDVKALAKRLHNLEERIATLGRSRQLTASSIPVLVDGEDGPETVEMPLTAGVSQGVRAGAAAQKAQNLADAAMDAAARSERTALGLARHFGETEPEAPEGGWPVGAEWVKTVAGVPREVFVWDGTGWVHAQYLADEILIPGADGAIRLGDSTVSAPNMAAGALDAYTVNALQMYGGYIEAPVIASSDKLGSGANTLNDPTFVSAVDEAWVASGHLGDSQVTQRDTVVWDQTWTMPKFLGGGIDTFRNRGNASADFKLTPGVRKPGSLVFANYSWLDTSPRSFNNPYTFQNQPVWSVDHGQFGGQADKSMSVDNRAPVAGTGKTTFLTNTAAVPVVAGELWNVRLSFDRVSAEELPLLTAASVQLLDATTTTVLAELPISSTQLMSGDFNQWWESTHTGPVKFRLKATYTAGGGGVKASPDSEKPKMMRSSVAGSFSEQLTNGTVTASWSSPPAVTHAYKQSPASGLSVADYNWTPRGTYSDAYRTRAYFAWSVLSAVFAKVEPQKGWRLTEEGGLELFNSLGAKTGNIDGQNNFLAGRFATADSGMRWEVQGDQVTFFDATNAAVGGLRRAGAGVELFGAVSFKGDTAGWQPVTPGPGFLVGGLSNRTGYMVKNNTLWISFFLQVTSGFSKGQLLTIPASVAPVGDGVLGGVWYSGTGQSGLLHLSATGVLSTPVGYGGTIATGTYIAGTLTAPIK